MKLYYGYFDEEGQFEIDIEGSKSVIQAIIDDLMQIYDWVTVVDADGNDITTEFD